MASRTNNRNPIFPAVASLSAAVALQGPALGAPPQDLRSAVNETLRLRSGEVVSIQVHDAAGPAPLLSVPDDVAPGLIGDLGLVRLTPHSVRGAGYRVLAQRADGSLEAVPPGPVRTFRGSIVGVPGSDVAASRDGDGLHVEIAIPGHETSWLEPVAGRVPGAKAGDYALYRSGDVVADEVGCGATAGEGGGAGGAAGTGGSSSSLFIAELAIDVDYEYFARYGSVAAVEERINAIINAANVQFERDVSVRHVITAIVVRTTADDPYTANAADDLASQFRLHWVFNHADIHRDVAQLFTGRNLSGNTIGWAFYNGICNLGGGYGVVQSDWTANFAGVTDLTAHELGHNWGARHCTCENPDYTMNPRITGANEFHANFTIPGIEEYRDALSCLEPYSEGSGGPPAAPGDLVATPISTTEIALAWIDHADDELGFEVERSLDGSTWHLAAGTGIDETAYLESGVTPGATCSYRVRAINANGASGYTNVAVATTEQPPPAEPPAAPADLKAAAISTSAVALSWTDRADDELGFSLERSLEGRAWAAIADLDPDAAGFLDEGLPSGTTCSYRVVAWNDEGSSAYSNVATATTEELPPTAPPAAPADLTAAAASTSAIALAWTDRADDELGFSLERSLAGGPWSVIADLGIDATGFVDDGLPADTTCSYRVTAWNDGGSSASSNVATATTDAGTPTSTTLPLTELDVVKGVLEGGGPSDLEASDDRYADIGAIKKGSRYLTKVMVSARSPEGGLSHLRVGIEVAVTDGPVNCGVYLRNFRNGKWKRLGTTTLNGSGDLVLDFGSLSSPHRFVDDATGELSLRIQTDARGGQTPNGYVLRIDRIALDVSP